MRLRILTWNLWHGLNPYQPILMLPMEKTFDSYWRRKRQIQFLKSWVKSPTDIVCLQEVNPVYRRTELIKSATRMNGKGCIVNTGLKVGRVGLPPFLQEGLATLVGMDFQQNRFNEVTLSGSATEVPIFKKNRAFFQLSERRKALLFQGNVGSYSIAVVNLHLHHGPDTVPIHRDRKKMELKVLMSWVDEIVGHYDLLVICGDFNCDPNSPCLEPMLNQGFKCFSNQETGLPTWDPSSNPHALKSSQLATSNEAKSWDNSPHEFDRIYYKSNIPMRLIDLQQFRDPDLSDHYSVAVEVEL